MSDSNKLFNSEGKYLGRFYVSESKPLPEGFKMPVFPPEKLGVGFANVHGIAKVTLGPVQDSTGA